MLYGEVFEVGVLLVVGGGCEGLGIVNWCMLRSQSAWSYLALRCVILVVDFGEEWSNMKSGLALHLEDDESMAWGYLVTTSWSFGLVVV